MASSERADAGPRIDWDRRATWHWAMALVLVLGVAWIAFSSRPAGGASAEPIALPREGYPAPDFGLRTLDGEEMRLSELRGQVVLINFWATWCPPCRQEMPAIQAAYDAYREEGFEVLAVNTGQSEPETRAFIDEIGTSFPVLVDLDAAVSARYQVTSLPTTFLVDRQGVIREIVIGGPLSRAYLKGRVRALLAEGDGE